MPGLEKGVNGMLHWSKRVCVTYFKYTELLNSHVVKYRQQWKTKIVPQLELLDAKWESSSIYVIGECHDILQSDFIGL